MSKKTSTILTVIGFTLFFLGMLALSLSLVGVQLVILEWIDNWGGLTGLLVRLVMIISGLVLIVAARGNFSGEDA
jgi:hypothetical protein